uniref:Transcription initiation factor TFIID subunit 2 n=2 Tax=Macrostomum lignano TaxID=282301 RepID=A0A1I8H674_9PLAT
YSLWLGLQHYGLHCRACISLACRQKIDQRKIDHAGIQYEEVPLLNTRAWMSSVSDESLSQYGPQMAVDDDVNTYASHEKKYSAVDAGYHWIIIELPYQALVTHVTILSVNDSVVCQDYAKSDLYLIGTLTMIVGRYFNKGFMCIVGKSVDPMTFRSSEKSKKLQTVITEKTTSCKLWYNHKPWKNLTVAMFLSKSYSDFGLKGLEGAELLAAADMTSTPDSLFTSASGRRYQFKSANKKVDWYNKLISWKYWTVCGRFSNLLTRTTIGMEEIMLNQACRSQHALFLAIRSTKPLKIFDIQAYRRVSQKPVGGIPPAYLSFACPTSQYGGFTPEFVSANLRPYKLDMSQMGRFYDLLNISVTKLLDVNRACYLPDLRQNPYMEITNRACNYTRETIRVTQLSYRKSITKVVQNFVKSSMEPDIPDYILNVLANLAEDFLKSWGGEVTVRRDPIQFKLNWTSYMMT